MGFLHESVAWNSSRRFCCQNLGFCKLADQNADRPYVELPQPNRDGLPASGVGTLCLVVESARIPTLRRPFLRGEVKQRHCCGKSCRLLAVPIAWEDCWINAWGGHQSQALKMAQQQLLRPHRLGGHSSCINQASRRSFHAMPLVIGVSLPQSHMVTEASISLGGFLLLQLASTGDELPQPMITQASFAID